MGLLALKAVNDKNGRDQSNTWNDDKPENLDGRIRTENNQLVIDLSEDPEARQAMVQREFKYVHTLQRMMI